METILDPGHIELEHHPIDPNDGKSISDRPIEVPQRESYLFEDANRKRSNVFRNIDGTETRIKLEEDETDLDEVGPVTSTHPAEFGQFNKSSNGNANNLLRREESIESHIKIEEGDTNLDENWPVTDTLSRQHYQCDVMLIPLESRQGPHKICNIKQEEFGDDVNGIIAGFLDDDNDDILLDNEHNREELKQKGLEDHHAQVSRFQLILFLLTNLF